MSKSMIYGTDKGMARKMKNECLDALCIRKKLFRKE